MHWVHDFRRIISQQPCVLVTLDLISGSAPRASGSRMIVTADEIAGSIGGGNLEHQATGMARDLLTAAADGFQQKKLYGLGPELNQCCGGAVALLYEVFREPPPWLDELEMALETGRSVVLASALDTAASRKSVFAEQDGIDESLPGPVVETAREWLSDSALQQRSKTGEISTAEGAWWLEWVRDGRRPVWLFGAGHVGHAVAHALGPLPFRVTWVDNRKDVFPENTASNIRMLETSDPTHLVAEAEPGSIFIVMTHSHQLDEDICHQVLQRNDYAWLGLIGSATKRRRFVHRLTKRGVEASRLDSLICPVGLSSIRGKQPATIALSLAAQLMQNNED